VSYFLPLQIVIHKRMLQRVTLVILLLRLVRLTLRIHLLLQLLLRNLRHTPYLQPTSPTFSPCESFPFFAARRRYLRY